MVSPSGELDWSSSPETQETSIAAWRHLANFSLNCSGSIDMVESSCSGLLATSGGSRCSSSAIKLTSSLLSSCQPHFKAPTERRSIASVEDITDVEFLDRFEEVFDVDGSSVGSFDDAVTDSGRDVTSTTSADISRLVRAPIISDDSFLGRGIKALSPREGFAVGKENVSPTSSSSRSVARRNIFADVSPYQADNSASSPLGMTLAAAVGVGGEGRVASRKWRRQMSVPEPAKHHRGGPMLAKCRSESDATCAARCMDLVVEADLYNDDGRHANLIGDFSRSHCLPLLAAGKHQDLKAISCHTMARVLNKEFDDVIAHCSIIDCRYPFEFAGGHIPGALNYYSKDDIINEFISPPSTVGNQLQEKRNIIIFHCEFSSERGPKLLRFLRNKDRDEHADCYPKLRHPEIYLLEGGYCEFQTFYGQLCVPVGGYVPMVDRKFSSELTLYRQASKVYGGTVERKRTTSVTGARGRYCRI